MKKDRFVHEAAHLALEVVLILGAVLIFRSVWHLLDMIPGFDTPSSLAIMLVIGVATTVVVFNLLFKHEERHHQENARKRHAN